MTKIGWSLVLFAGSVCAAAQTYTAKTIKFSDRGDFTQQQLEDAAGIHAGTSFKADDLAAAAQHLVDTGYFESAGATLDGKITAVTVLFDIKPIPRSAMLRVGYTNLVWLTRDEITAAIHAKLPLFNGYLPENSPHQDDIRTALYSALAAKSVTAKLTYDTYEPTLRHPVREIAFSVVMPDIKVANIKLGGVTAELAPLIQKSVNTTVRTLYSEGPADQTTAERLLAGLLDAGYVQAALSDVTLTPSQAVDGSIALTVAAKLAPGELYHVSAITFAGTPLISADDFNAKAKLHPGDIASHAALLQTLQPIDTAYRRQGYMDVAIQAVPTLDTAARQVAYIVTVEPGEQYRVGALNPRDLDPAALAEFNSAFGMKQGQIYNPEYVATFLNAHPELKALQKYGADFKAYADPGTHTVELLITFIRIGR